MNSILKSGEELRILEVCETHLGPLGLRPVDVDFRRSGRSLVRVFIDSSQVEPTQTVQAGVCSQGVSVEDCARVSRLLGPVLDSLDLLGGAYDLEVSSPGLDRRLRLESDFEAAVGRRVKVKKLADSKKGSASVTGVLERVQDGALMIQTGGQTVVVRLDEVTQAVRVWESGRN